MTRLLKQLVAFILIFSTALTPPIGAAFTPLGNPNEAVASSSVQTQNSLFNNQALALALGNARHPIFMKISSTPWLWRFMAPYSTVLRHDQDSPTPNDKMPNKDAHKTVQAPLRTAFAMGSTKYFLPWLSVHALGMVERIMIASISFAQIAFFVIREPKLFNQSLFDAALHLSSLFFTSPVAIITFASLFIGHFVTGVVRQDEKSPDRWNIPETLKATEIAAAGGLLSVVFFILGLLLPMPWGYGVIAAGFFLGPWLPAHFNQHADPLTGPMPSDSSRKPNRREVLRSLLALSAFSAVWATDLVSLLSVDDNRQFLKDEETPAGLIDFSESSSDDKSIKIAQLSSGLIRYRDMNPQGRNVVLGFHGFQESLYEFPLALQTKLQELDIRGIFLERPGIGPFSTPWPGHDLADWAGLVEEFNNKVLDDQPISIVGHSAGGVYALACAKLASVKALALVSSPVPMTYGSFFKTFFDYDPFWQGMVLGLELFPHKLLQDVQLSCEQIMKDWKAFLSDMLKVVGPMDREFITQNEEAFRKNMVTSVLQGAAVTIEDFRRVLSPWPLTLADTTRIPVAIFRGGDDRLVPPSATQELQKNFVPHATRIDFPNMGHQPALSHYEKIFEIIGNLHVQEEKNSARLLSSAA